MSCKLQQPPLQDLTEQLSAKEQETAELDAMLEEAQTESESHQTALRDCQDMLEELQTFSQGQEAKLQQLQSQLQVTQVTIVAQCKISLEPADGLKDHIALPALKQRTRPCSPRNTHAISFVLTCSASVLESFP